MEKLKKRIANLKVSGKLKVYRMTVLVMTLFLVLVALSSTLVLRSNIEKITEVWSPALEYLQELETMTAKYRIKQYQHLVESDAAAMNSCEEEIQKLESQIQDTSANLDAIMSADSDAQKGQDDYEVAKAAWEEYRAASDKILKLSRADKQQEAAKLMTGEVYEEYKSFTETLTSLRDEFQVELDRAKTTANVCTIIIFVVIVAAGLAIAVVTTLIGKIITKSITEPVEQIEAAVASLRKGELSNVEMLTYESEDEFGDTIRNLKEAMGILADYVSEISGEVKAIAQGDLTRNGDDITDFLGDFSELKASLLYILKHFNSTLTEISNLAEQVSSNASEVKNASKSLSDGATEQAGVIEELNATIDNVVDLAEDTAKETQSASARVKASANKANEEKEKMNELLTEMEHITEISKEIGNIITDIEDIASQTNLLSLNASIEAARAGEAGRGFAVVADQIGKLAADSAKSAVNTRDLIDKTLEEIEKGNTITRTTADAFNQIIADMESFAELAQNTMEKANSQAESLEQIGQGIEQLSSVVQGNAASSEENTAISVNLAEGAAKMHDRVNIFKLF
jgi:methyl-accepting chemotaxis protein